HPGAESRHPAAEGDAAVARREHGRAGRGGELDPAPLPRGERTGARVAEARDDLACDRSAPAGSEPAGAGGDRSEPPATTGDRSEPPRTTDDRSGPPPRRGARRRR